MKLTPVEGKWFDYGDGVRFKLNRMPFDGIGDFTFYDKAILDWEGIEDADGKPLPCKRGTKLYLLYETEEGSEIQFWIMRKLQNIEEFLDIPELKKKLEQRLDGSSITPKPTRTDV